MEQGGSQDLLDSAAEHVASRATAPTEGRNESRAESLTQTPTTGRFAPSPTGPLHLGSLVAAVGSWLFARHRGGRWLVRMEDLDAPRMVSGAAQETLDTLRRYGLRWDGDPVYQSRRRTHYATALERLQVAGRVYPCACSRADLRRAASAPAPEDPSEATPSVYPGTCRRGLPEGRRARALRFRVRGEQLRFTDVVQGVIEEDVAAVCGDFVVQRADGPFAYQLAVVVDDAAQGVTQVVRGGDLLTSTARQILLQRSLGYPTPVYAHLPLLLDDAGRKLGKRDGALPLPDLSRERILSTLRLALRWLGLPELGGEEPRSLLERALDAFSPGAVPRGPTYVSAKAAERQR